MCGGCILLPDTLLASVNTALYFHWVLIDFEMPAFSRVKFHFRAFLGQNVQEWN